MFFITHNFYFILTLKASLGLIRHILSCCFCTGVKWKYKQSTLVEVFLRFHCFQHLNSSELLFDSEDVWIFPYNVSFASLKASTLSHFLRASEKELEYGVGLVRGLWVPWRSLAWDSLCAVSGSSPSAQIFRNFGWKRYSTIFFRIFLPSHFLFSPLQALLRHNWRVTLYKLKVSNVIWYSCVLQSDYCQRVH